MVLSGARMDGTLKMSTQTTAGLGRAQALDISALEGAGEVCFCLPVFGTSFLNQKHLGPHSSPPSDPVAE